MASGDIRLRLDLSTLNAYAIGVSEQAVQRAANAAEKRVRANIIADDLINSGKMLAEVKTAPAPSQPLFPKRAIGSSVDWVKFPEFGTRAHGPVRAKYLKFTPKGSNRVVFAKWVRGVRAYGFMKRSLDHVRPTDFER